MREQEEEREERLQHAWHGGDAQRVGTAAREGKMICFVGSISKPRPRLESTYVDMPITIEPKSP